MHSLVLSLFYIRIKLNVDHFPGNSMPAPWSRVLQKLKLRNSPYFTEPEGSLPHFQVPATCPYPEHFRGNGLLI